MVAAVKKSIEDKRGKVTVSSLSREFNLSRSTMDRLVKKDLGLTVYKRTPRQVLKPVDKEKRLKFKGGFSFRRVHLYVNY
uniref:Uncharacterized protein n=1 Tax=Lepeophtheirus salmonis TaxID=72036 RepID=A0A0K2UXA4_LEPSM